MCESIFHFLQSAAHTHTHGAFFGDSKPKRVQQRFRSRAPLRSTTTERFFDFGSSIQHTHTQVAGRMGGMGAVSQHRYQRQRTQLIKKKFAEKTKHVWLVTSPPTNRQNTIELLCVGSNRTCAGMLDVFWVARRETAVTGWHSSDAGDRMTCGEGAARVERKIMQSQSSSTSFRLL